MTYFEPGTYTLQGAGKTWSYANSGSNMRFELRSGDRWVGDSNSTVERSEIASYKTLAFNQSYTVQYKFMIEPGAINTAKWLVIGQLHATEDEDDEGVSPPFELGLMGERMQVTVHWSTSAQTNWSNVTENTLYTDTKNVQRGHWYDIKLTVKFDPFGNGLLDVWRDGIQLVDYNGPLGFNDQVGPYWKNGIYRKAASETIAINYSDFFMMPSVSQNMAPTQISLNGDSALELAARGTVVGLLAAEDPNAGDQAVFTMLDSAGGRFALDPTGTRVVVHDGLKLDYEQANFHTIKVRATDKGGLFIDRTLTVKLGDVFMERADGTMDADRFVGGSGADAFHGQGGNDTLYSRDGRDRLTGGAGADVFVFDTKPNKKTNIDKITDFNARYDSIWLNNAIFKAADLRRIGKGKSEVNPGKLKAEFFKSFDKKHPLNQDKNDYVLYNKSTGALSYDADGSGKGAAIQIASLNKNLPITAKDFFIV